MQSASINMPAERGTAGPQARLRTTAGTSGVTGSQVQPSCPALPRPGLTERSQLLLLPGGEPYAGVAAAAVCVAAYVSGKIRIHAELCWRENSSATMRPSASASLAARSGSTQPSISTRDNTMR